MEIEQLQEELEEIRELTSFGQVAFAMIMTILIIALIYLIVKLCIEDNKLQKEKEEEKKELEFENRQLHKLVDTYKEEVNRLNTKEVFRKAKEKKNGK